MTPREQLCAALGEAAAACEEIAKPIEKMRWAPGRPVDHERLAYAFDEVCCAATALRKALRLIEELRS